MYRASKPASTRSMINVQKTWWAVIHQTVLFVSLIALPLAFLAQHVGIPLDKAIKRLMETVGKKYANAS